MAVDDDLVERMRAVLAGAGAVREVRMFGGLCFMLDGNMGAGTSKRGLLVRVGKERQSEALARPGVKPMEMGGRMMEGTFSSIRRRTTKRLCGIGSGLPSAL
jgi:TfoX/Sxy family transcriptional regulator of competence genes